MSRLSRLFAFTTALAATYLAWVFIARAVRTSQWTREHSPSAAVNSEFDKTYGGSDVKILQFYAREGNVIEGSKSLICYGVLNAKSVRIEPPVEAISPALNRCLEAAPTRETRYTLVAEGQDGRTVSESFVLGVRPDQAALPRITSFEIVKRERDYAGNWIFSVSFAAQNPEEVTIDPPVLPPLHRSPNGAFYVSPRKTTTYTLTVTGKYGHKVRRQLIVQVPPA